MAIYWLCEDPLEDDFIEIEHYFDENCNLRIAIEYDEGSVRQTVYMSVESVMSIRNHLNKVLEGL